MGPEPRIEGGATVRQSLDALLSDDGYLPLVYCRAHMDEAEARSHLAEFCAQAEMRGASYRDLQRLGEHFVNWLGKKKKYEDERNRTKYGNAEAASSEERERERHSAVLQRAYELIAGSSRDN